MCLLCSESEKGRELRIFKCPVRFKVNSVSNIGGFPVSFYHGFKFTRKNHETENEVGGSESMKIIQI